MCKAWQSVLAVLCLLGSWAATHGADHRADPLDELRAAVTRLHRWVDAGPHGEAWRTYLRSDQLEVQVAKGAKADAAKVVEVLARYAADHPELDHGPIQAVRAALERWLADLVAGSSPDAMVQRVREAGAAFSPVGRSAIARSHARLVEALGRLDDRLTRAGPESQAWRDYLRWEDLLAQTRTTDAPDLGELDALFAKLDAGHEGLGLRWFRDVRGALRDYITAIRAARQERLDEHYAAVLDALAAHLEKIGPNPTAEETAALASALGWLDDARQAPWLVSAVRRRFDRPNLVAHLSAEVVRRGVARQVDDVAPVADVILGTQLRGTGRTTGRIVGELVPNDGRAELEVRFSGKSTTSTIGYNGPARIYSDGETTLAGVKRVWIDAEGVRAEPAEAQGHTRTRTRGVCVVRGGRCLEKMVRRRASRQKPQAERIAAQHAEDRLERRIDEGFREVAERTNARLRERWRRPLLERRLLPGLVQLSTSDEALRVAVLQAATRQLAAPGDPPPLEGAPDLALRVHESMVNNSAEVGLAGMILTQRRLAEALEGVVERVPEELAEDDGEPWTIFFAHQKPVFVAFDGGQLRLTVRGRAYGRGESRHPAMDVTATYRIERTDSGFKAVRQGDLQVFPPGFEPESGQTISAREQVIRDMLQRRFATLFVEEIAPEPVTLPGAWEAAGPLRLCQWDARDGWLVMAWKRVGPDERGTVAAR